MSRSQQWEMRVYRDPLLRNVTILVVAVIERGPQPKDACTPIFIYEIDHFVHPLPVFQVVASVFPDTMAISSAFFVIVGTRTLLLENIRWILPLHPGCNRGILKPPWRWQKNQRKKLRRHSFDKKKDTKNLGNLLVFDDLF